MLLSGRRGNITFLFSRRKTLRRSPKETAPDAELSEPGRLNVLPPDGLDVKVDSPELWTEPVTRVINQELAQQHHEDEIDHTTRGDGAQPV